MSLHGTLRDYQPEDFQTVCAIDRSCFPPGIAYSPGDIALALDNYAFAIVWEEDRRVVAFVLAVNDRPNRGRIITIDVLPEYRQKGVGGALMAEAHRRLKQMGATRVLLETSVENAPAIAFYQRFGYVTVRRLPRYYLGKADAFLMAKDL